MSDINKEEVLKDLKRVHSHFVMERNCPISYERLCEVECLVKSMLLDNITKGELAWLFHWAAYVYTTNIMDKFLNNLYDKLDS